jgi:hypothetical protein
MAVFTAAALAIGAAWTAVAGAVTAGAVTAATVGAVATAVVTTSAAIGVVGLGLTAVGMVTKNESLLKAGRIAGYVGLAGGLVGWGAGSAAMGAGEFANQVGQMYSAGWNTGVGSMFQSDPGIIAAKAGATQEALGRGIVSAASPEYAANMAPSTIIAPPEAQAALGQGIVTGTQSAQPAAAPLAAAPGAVDLASTTPGAMAPQASTVSTPVGSAAGTAAPVGSIAGTQAPGYQLPQGAVQPGGPQNQSWWGKVPDWMKAQMLTTAGQGVAGMASGWMTGLSAEERLEFDQYMNSQNQAQRELINRNNAYVPSLSFKRPGSLVAAAGRPA